MKQYVIIKRLIYYSLRMFMIQDSEQYIMKAFTFKTFKDSFSNEES